MATPAETVDPVTSPHAPTPAPARGPASSVPRFMFFTDFDGTVTRTDSNHHLVDTFGSGRETRMRGDADIVAGRRSFHDVWTELLNSVAQNRGISECVAWLLQNVSLDGQFRTFYEWCKSEGVEVVVLSGGMQAVIERLLEGLLGKDARGELRVVSNQASKVAGRGGIEVAGGWEITWHDESPFGHDKSVEMRKYSRLPEGERPVLFYAGDGISDFSAARETDVLFAKAGCDLVRYCDAEKIPHVPFDDFGTILDVTREIVAGDIGAKEAMEKYGKSYA